MTYQKTETGLMAGRCARCPAQRAPDADQCNTQQAGGL